jgi:predicted nucleic-acid-binding protein
LQRPRCPRRKTHQKLFIPTTVALELEWVLRPNFGFNKVEAVHPLSELLATTELTFESEAEAALEHALSLLTSGQADFSDCVPMALAAQAGEQALWTFDTAAANATGAQLIG